ncbi:MAG: hypoxanthine phosphoribosyltransferase [Dehalococcoidia bacterium]|nr:hypoxanthine phosphoribosyltransferase [Dehalococcoidia bacterium]
MEFAHILDFYGVKWSYEPRSFPLRWDGDRILEMFTPDFYLPDLDLYVELTTLRQRLVTEKNRKLRQLRELYPDVNVKLLYKRDYHRLLAKYGYGPLVQGDIQTIDRVLIDAEQVQKRVGELGRQIALDYAGTRPVLVGVLKGVLCFMPDLMRQVSLPLSVEFMSISYFSGDGGGVKITKDLDGDITGQHVVMVEDIVDTGMTLNYLLNYLRTRNPASVRVCTLLDKRVRRLVDVPLDYVGLEIPDEFVVGYGLDYLEKYRNLSFIGVLNPQDNEETQRPTAEARGKRVSPVTSATSHQQLTPLAATFRPNPGRLLCQTASLLSYSTHWPELLGILHIVY